MSTGGDTSDRVEQRLEYESAPAPPRSWLRRQAEGLNTLLVAVVIALAIRAFVIEPFRIPSGSMLDTLLIGDHLFVNKFVYGVRIPFTELRLPGLREPERGDVVVFTVARQGQAIHPADRRPDLPREEFVKRIVGLPGDTIEVDRGRIVLNGREVAAEDTGETFADEAGRQLRVKQQTVGDCGFRVLDDTQLAGLRQSRFTVEPGRYFVMGDNRDHSNDSRAWGTVRLEEVKGPAFVLYWSWDFNGSWGSLLNPVNWWDLLAHRTRWGRIGDGVGCD